MTQILNGFETSKRLRQELKEEVSKLSGRKPGLAVVIVGEDPASQTYVASKAKQATSVGFESKIVKLDETISQDKLIEHVQGLNNDDTIDGILVQLPLPSHIDEDTIIESIDPLKDVDGLHPLNVGYLELNKATLAPCTPKGIMRLLKEYKIELEGKNVLVIGRSRLVGKPIATMLLQENATVTTAHSRTKNLKNLISQNEIIVVAIGQREFIKANMLNENQIVIDVGIHRHDGQLVGDVDKQAYDKVKAITPVPKGVGPMTIYSLLENTLVSYKEKES
ncbi:MAG TPA: bifunctional 5,10-methylenetetrahydrofolate dehydrogenase/5,10-methenyltetrahydrofolate cyclohydrolase [Erysipelothrix sp.]|nr:bifunctional 5,10-methylenetetrahydrofolate dehydrogenase/5,10-methenyltetrahydrofolate cyclohydrolase [Erysipelothrix sp.]